MNDNAACGKIICKKCSPEKIELAVLGYMGLQRICINCCGYFKKIEKQNRKKSKSKRIDENTQIKIMSPMRRSGIFFNSPASSQLEESDDSENQINKIHYFNFVLHFDNKYYPDLQAALSEDRIIISGDKSLPLNICILFIPPMNNKFILIFIKI